MTATAHTALKAPFPYFGGKGRAAGIIWGALGDPGGYIEPFAGSAAVLLARPPFRGRRVETINDADGWLVNTWRAIKHSPEQVARHASWPVTEIDYHARLAWLQERRTPDLISWLEGDPEAHDPKAAGWWLYVCACGIGDPWGPGPWRVIDGHLRDSRTLPQPGAAGQGVNRKLPDLGTAGKGVNRGDSTDERITAYMRALAHRLRHVRITCGDWRRVLTTSVTRASAGGDGSTGILLDPPYATSGDLYATTSEGVSNDVRAWCIEEAAADHRIVICGYDDEHDELIQHGWRRVYGKAGSGRGYSANPLNGRRERLWLSPACVAHDQLDIFTAAPGNDRDETHVHNFLTAFPGRDTSRNDRENGAE